MSEQEYAGTQRWSRDKQAVFAVIWISFLCAAVGSMVFFALFDPVELVSAFDEDITVDRSVGYTAGFFFFWVLTFACSAITAFLVHTAPNEDEKPNPGQD